MIGPERGRYRDKVSKLVTDAQGAERAGFASIWVPQIPDEFDALTAVALMGDATTSIELGTAVMPIQTRHPVAMAQQALADQAVCEGRFVLGLGPSHHWIVEDMLDGLSNWMDEKGYRTLPEFTGKAVPSFVDWEHLNLQYVVKARIDQDLCIQCGRCPIACEDTSHQAITKEKNGRRYYEVNDKECVGCNLCVAVCPVENCITLYQLPDGSIDPRTGRKVGGYGDWTTHPNNPGSGVTA